MIDVTATQAALLAAGYNPGPIDGSWGRGTMTAILCHQVQRQPDAMLKMFGQALANELPKHGITATKFRLAEFTAETSHETGGYTRFEENMHYSAKRLIQIWPNRFKTLQSALPYAWDPTDPDKEDVALANYVYGTRMGNESNGTNDNDGWDNRGGGLIQHTGKAEYTILKSHLELTSEQIHTDPASMVLAVCDYWDRVKANDYIDRSNFVDLRKRVNGGTLGVDDVAAKRNRSLLVIK
jgi:putative chitinase